MEKNRVRHLLRVLRPLSWWLLLVLILYGIRLHQRWIERTRLDFSIKLQGASVQDEATAAVDGRPVIAGERISLGTHKFIITHPKAVSFTTNLFIWYGERNLGEIALIRSKGSVAIRSVPPAARLNIEGADFSVILTNSPGMTSSIPTGRYRLEAMYPYWHEYGEITVSEFLPATKTFAPAFGVLNMKSSYADTAFTLTDKSGDIRIQGNLPTTINELPIGTYDLTTTRKGEWLTKSFWLGAGKTNDVLMEYKYGAILLESDPMGAVIFNDDGRELGATPLTLSELHPGRWNFTLQRDGYEQSVVTLDVTSNETNRFQTNLVNHQYAAALRSAQQYFDFGRYDDAAVFAIEALKYRTNDVVALALQRSATGMGHLSHARSIGNSGEFAAAVTEINTALQFIPDNDEAKQLLADFTKREEQRVLAEKQRQAEQAEQERRRHEAEVARQKNAELHASFTVLLNGFENSSQFREHELTTTNTTGTTGAAIRDVLCNGESAFQMIRFERTRSDIFALQARQLLAFGYRDCFVVGEDIRPGETRLLYKVLEYDHPPEVKLFGGVVRATFTQTSTTPEQQARFAEQIREGESIVGEKLRQVTGE